MLAEKKKSTKMLNKQQPSAKGQRQMNHGRSDADCCDNNFIL